MKRFILFSIALFGFSQIYSQTLVRENNHWSGLIEAAWPIGEYSFHFQKLQGDTVFQNKTYKKLLGTSDTLQVKWDYEGAMREDTPGKVYFRAAGSFSDHLIYDFNIVVNDTFTGFYYENEYKMIVDSIVQIQLLNGEWRKQYYFTGISGFYGYENWIEEIGSDNGLTNSGVFFSITDYYPSLNCFTENGVVKVYNNSFFSCYSIVGISEAPNQQSSTIIPNPVQEYATIELLGNKVPGLKAKIYSSTGLELQNINASFGNTFLFTRGSFNSGLYFYIIYDGEKQVSLGKFIIQ